MGNLVGEGSDEDGRRFHVDADAASAAKVALELLVVLPHPSIRRIDGPRVVVLLMGDNGVGNGHLEPKRRQGRDFFRVVAVSPLTGVSPTFSMVTPSMLPLASR